MKITLLSILLLTFITNVQAANVSTPSGKVKSVRTYQVGTDGLRAQITLSGATHDCGTQPTILYFDSHIIPTDVVKAVLSLAFGAMAADHSVIATYDCSLGSGGYGWGYALSVTK